MACRVLLGAGGAFPKTSGSSSSGAAAVGKVGIWVRTLEREFRGEKTPTLTVIDASSTPNPLAPPATLGEAGRRLWADIHGDYIVTDAAGLEMLAQICAEADRVAQCAE